jgi:cysteine desulfurase
LRWETENVAGFVGFGAGANIARKELAEETPRLKQFREHISRELSRAVPHSYIWGHPTRRLPGHLSIGVRGQEREVGKLLAVLDAAAFPSRLAAPVAPTIPGNLPASS